jgi:Fe2+ or Zn2+ uptake regulation protein
MLTRNQASVLEALDNQRQGLYGRELVELTRPAVGLAFIYTVLEELCDSGLAREELDEKVDGFTAARTRHFITDRGRQALQVHAAGNASFGAETAPA